MKENEFVTSDTHFGHGRVIQYSHRPIPERPKDIAEIEIRIHLGKEKDPEVLKYYKRWLNKHVHEMDQFLIDAWNRKVPKEGAIVYHLGDFSLCSKGRTIEILKQLNGTIRLIKGNHDKIIKGEVLHYFDWVKDWYESTTSDGRKIIMHHYAYRTWKAAHKGSWNLHGHSHGSLQDLGTPQLDIGVDTHPNYEPYSYAEVLEKMKGREYIPVDHHGRHR